MVNESYSPTLGEYLIPVIGCIKYGARTGRIINEALTRGDTYTIISNKDTIVAESLKIAAINLLESLVISYPLMEIASRLS